MKTVRDRVAIVFLFVLCLLAPAFTTAEEITLRLGTLGAAGTSVTNVVDIAIAYWNKVGKGLGHSVKLIPYYGGVMGDEPEMNQKLKMGQLDLVTPTGSSLPDLIPEIEPIYMPFLVTEYGQYDYIMKAALLRELGVAAYKRGTVILAPITEGYYHFYQYGFSGKCNRTPEAARKHIKFANWTGAADDMFAKPLGIPQTVISVPEAPSMLKMGLVNASLSPALYVVGVQIYTTRPCIMLPQVRTGCSGLVISQSKYEKLPIDLKIPMLLSLPALQYVANGILRDAADVYLEAMFRYGCEKMELTPEELKLWKEPCVAYRETYLGSDQTKRKFYGMISQALDGYSSKNPSERRIFNNDPTYKRFPERLAKVAGALKAFLNSGSLDELKALEEQLVIEKWRLHDMITASKELIKTGDSSSLRHWSEQFLPQTIADDFFGSNEVLIKRFFGTDEALKERVRELLVLFENTKYKGYHK